MIGRLDSNRREATVVGAGISGLLAAHALDKHGYCVTLLEREARAGGLIQTRQTDYGRAEAAAHSLLATSAVRELCGELGVELIGVRKDSRARYIWRDGRMRKFPLSVGEFGRTLGRVAFAASENGEGQLDLEKWGRKHVGEAAVDYLLTPFVRGIYGIQPAEVGVVAAFPFLAVPKGQTLLGSMVRRSMKRSSAPKEKGKAMVAPRYGMGDLTTRLENHLEAKLGERFRRGVAIEEIPDAPNVLITTPANVTAGLLLSAAPELSRALGEIQYTPIVSVTAFVEQASFPSPVKGIGVLVPAKEKRQCLGVLFNSSSFENRVVDESLYASFTVLLGGSAQPQWISASDEEIKGAVRDELHGLLGMKGEPLQFVINRWPRAIPKYSVGLPEVWETARTTWCSAPGRILFGNYTGQVSLRGIIETAATLS